MSDEREWKDANPATVDLPDKGRAAIMCIVGGVVIGVLAIVGMRIRPLGLAAGSFAFFTGIGMLMRLRLKRLNINPKIAIIVTVAGFLMLLANPRFGLVAGFAGYFLVVGAIGLVVLGLSKAIKLAWDLGRRP